MRSEDIRRTFLQFYEERGHRVVPSSSLIPSDPTLLFSIAGMVQFKPYFEGREKPPFPRATTVQKCFRTENIEDVGNNAKDGTFFEMLGNFSFADYFKKEACAWAWELLTGPFGIDPDRIWVSVYVDDDEAAEIWSGRVGVAERKIVRFKEDNFWHTGVAGPCGPCTELFVDRGPAFGPEHDRGPAGAPSRYPEIYNLVFMQYLQDAPFHVVGDLERTGVDTGMGLERLAAVLQDVPSIFETDLLAPVVARAKDVVGGGDQKVLHILADHSRAAAFLIADGVAPSNEGRGYVLRRVIRRAITKARRAGAGDVVLPPVCQAVIERFQEAYPELARNREGILEMVRREEERFRATLDAGLNLLEPELASATGSLSGEIAFKLHDTYGFPLEITRDVAEDAGLEVDEAEFERLMDEQRTRSQAVTAADKAKAGQSRVDAPPTEFLGYGALEAEGEILALISGDSPAPSLPEGGEGELVLSRTPFYPEGGGQIGDRGWIESGAGKAEVLETRPLGAVILHSVRVTWGELRVGDTVRATVSPAHRSGVERAHTATHMLHHTLRTVVGEHVRQMGSLVEPGRLRFDFSHYSGVPHDVLDEVEETVNARVLADDDVRWFETGYQQAVHELGAIAFFEDKYGDTVRVVEVGDYSRELCGGTHVDRTGRIGLVKLLGEGSIGSNIRRVEALTGIEGLRHVTRRLRAMERAAELARVPTDELVEGVERLVRTQKELQRSLAEQQSRDAGAAVDELLRDAREAAGTKIVVSRRDENVDTVRQLAIKLRDRLDRGVVILGTASDGGALLVGAASRTLVAEGIDPRDILRPAVAHIGGVKVGGKIELAMAGGARPEGLDEALAAAAREAEALLTR